MQHLGNVLATVSDKKFGVISGGGSLIDHYEPEIVSATDYYPFGMPSRVSVTGKGYRFGFNGKENDNDVKGWGNSQDYGLRIYDPRIGRFLSFDPLVQAYPWYTPYQFAGNKPIWFTDIDGLEEALPELSKKMPVLKQASESTCIGCAQNAAVMKIVEANLYLERLRKDYEAWRRNPDNIGKPLPPQYTTLAPGIGKSETFDQGGVLGTSEYKIAKERAKVLYSVSQYAPVTGDLHDLKDVATSLYQGDFVAAGMSAVFLIPGADFLKPVKSLVKTDKQLLKFAKETFEGNKALSKEATDLVDKARRGIDGGIGGHEVFKGVSEMRGKSGARVYYREVKGEIEILGYSNKNNQQKVIDRLKKVYGEGN
jgi:RHS repeat-associated protein